MQRAIIFALILTGGCLGDGLNPVVAPVAVGGSTPTPSAPANLRVNFDPGVHFFGGTGCDANAVTTITITNQGSGPAQLGTIDVGTIFTFGDSGGCNNNSGSDKTTTCIERFINSPLFLDKVSFKPYPPNPMEELHPVGVTEESRHLVEGTDPKLIKEGLLLARDKAWEAFHRIRTQITEGMTEQEGRKTALAVFTEMGVKKHWHQPYIRFGAGTQLTFHEPLRDDYKLQKNDPVYMDLGPVWTDSASGIEYEGDVGDSFAFGENADAEECIQTVRLLFKEAKQMWLEQNCSGKMMYDHIQKRAIELGYHMIENVVGHRVSDFPHQKYTKERMPNLYFSPSSHLWILELQIVHPKLPVGAFFEDLLY